MNLSPSQEKRMQQMVQAMDAGTVQQEDFVKVLQSLLKIVKEVKDTLDGKIVLTKASSDASVRNIDYRLDEVELKIKDLINSSEKNSLGKISELSQRLSKELARIDSVIGDMGETDDTNLAERVSQIENNIPKIGDLENDLPKLGEKIRDSLELLQGEERLDKSAIKGLEDELKTLEGKITQSRSGGGGFKANNATIFYDLSSQTNGVLKVFTVPKNKNAVVMSSDFPNVLMEGNGFTLNATRTQLTLTTTNAPSSGSQLLFQYTGIFNTL